MVVKLQQAVLRFRIEGTDEPLIARAGLVLPYEMARARFQGRHVAIIAKKLVGR